MRTALHTTFKRLSPSHSYQRDIFTRFFSPLFSNGRERNTFAFRCGMQFTHSYSERSGISVDISGVVQNYELSHIKAFPARASEGFDAGC